MTVAVGSRLGHYEITAKLGAGGMGEVWRAKDTHLGRDVALKVLPEGFAADPERLARFEREAKLLAHLNHPNIAHIHGLEVSGERRALVMELVEGPTLAERLEEGPLAVEESLVIALRIAEAVEEAHERGIIHRDLKPQNIKASADGKVKVLDFGLAKALEPTPVGPASQLAQSPTMTLGATMHGVILGTAGYMAPEQAAGGVADRRSDIWAFGVVFYEMLTGRRLFDGETVSHVLAGVLKEEPDFSALPRETPPRIARLLRRCLRKKPRERLQAIGDARIVINEVLAGAIDESAPASPTATLEPRRRPAWPLWAALVASLLVTAGLATRLLLDRPVPAKVVRATVLPPEGAQFHLEATSPGPVALSPDGSQLAFTATAAGKRTLWVRPVDSMLARELPGTEGAQYPFWSPDSQQLGFFAATSLKKIAVAGGPPMTLCGVSGAGKGGSWSRRGTIVFAATPTSALSVVAATGGEPRALTTLDKAQGDASHRHPRFLPDGERFLFLARKIVKGNELRVGSLDGSPPVRLIDTPANAEYAAGRLLFVRDKTLMAQPFDPEELELSGEPVPVVEDVLQVTAAALAVFSPSRAGSLAYQSGAAVSERRLVWRDRKGQELGTLGEPADLFGPRISPDGRRVAVTLNDPDSGLGDIWIYDVERGLRSRFTFDPAQDQAAIWSPDGETLAFGSARNGSLAVWSAPVSGTAPATLTAGTELGLGPNYWSPDSRWILALESGGASVDLLLVPASGGEPKKLIATEFNDGPGSISPDGRWLAFRSNETGRDEIYVTTFPEVGRRWQVSQGVGNHPVWRGDGRELFYRDPGGLYAVEVDGSGATFEAGKTTRLFDLPPSVPGPRQFDVQRDGQRVLIAEPIGHIDLPPITLVLNWDAGLAR